jgi:EREBP-like factor
VNSAASIQEPLVNLSSDQGTNSSICLDLSLENDTRTTDMTSLLAPVPTLTEVDESAFLQGTTNAMLPPMTGNANFDFSEFEPMNFLMDSSDYPINTFDDMPIPNGFY